MQTVNHTRLGKSNPWQFILILRFGVFYEKFRLALVA